jgi:hypothetical protein
MRKEKNERTPYEQALSYMIAKQTYTAAQVRTNRVGPLTPFRPARLRTRFFFQAKAQCAQRPEYPPHRMRKETHVFEN